MSILMMCTNILLCLSLFLTDRSQWETNMHKGLCIYYICSLWLDIDNEVGCLEIIVLSKGVSWNLHYWNFSCENIMKIFHSPMKFKVFIGSHPLKVESLKLQWNLHEIFVKTQWKSHVKIQWKFFIALLCFTFIEFSHTFHVNFTIIFSDSTFNGCVPH